MGNNAKILVIDDEESIRFTFSSFLSDEGYAVMTAADYASAIAHLDETPFDLIFADIILGGRSGSDVVREVRRRNLSCPVVMITGDPNVESAAEAVRLGAFDYLSKPVRQNTLLHIAQLALKHKAVHDEKEKYRTNLDAIFRSVRDAIVMVDNDMNIVEFNEAATVICGHTRTLVGTSFGSLPTACTNKCTDALAETLEKMKPVNVPRIECGYIQGRTQVVSLSTSPLTDVHGMGNGAVMVVRDETRLAGLERDLGERLMFHNIVGKSPYMQEIYSLIENLADVETTVLVSGESGTGKELVAEALHYSGGRGNKPLVKVNCSALSEGLLESELFGHVKGAFTGAVRDKVGRFQRADGGTIFLDEIGDVSQRIQLRLLRVLQEREFEPVGDSVPVKVDVRIISATNRDLLEKVKQGEFREDLYYRLKVIEIPLPPLRERRADIPLLIRHFLDKFNKKFHRQITAVTEQTQKLFLEYPWPGNIRELEHALEHAFILCRHHTIAAEHLPQHIRNFSMAKGFLPAEKKADDAQEIMQALEKTAWNKAKAARLLNMDRKTLYRKIKKYQIQKNDT